MSLHFYFRLLFNRPIFQLLFQAGSP